jgi:hypothetical protein
MPAVSPSILERPASSTPEDAVPFHLAPPPDVAWPTAHWDATCDTCGESIPQATCTRCGGVWDEGMLGLGNCACPYVDAGKPCRDERDCKGTCAISWEDALGHGGTQCNDAFCIGPGAPARKGVPWGTCATHGKRFGCQGWISAVSTAYGWMRETKWICRD